MKKNRIFIYFLTAAILLIFVFVCTALAGEQEKKILFSVQVSSDEKTENIKCWQDENDEYYVFLPSYANLEQAEIKLNTETEIIIDGKVLKDGMTCAGFQLGKTYNLTYSDFWKKCSRSITFMKSENVATMYIDTASGNMDYINSNKKNQESAEVSVVNADGTLDYVGNIESISGRGNSTWELYEKKPYNIKFAYDTNLLKIGEAQNWILLANAADSSNLRNKLIYDFAKKIGLENSPDSEWVDLYLNGEYAGLYLLCEKNEIHANRVNISQKDSFLVSLEYEDKLRKQKIPYITTHSKQALRIRHLSYSEIELEEEWQKIENAILSDDNIDAESGKYLWDMIDLDSWVKKYLIEEVFANFDGGFVSQFFYKDGENSKVKAGPVWDYDLSAGIDTFQCTNPQTMMANRLNPVGEYETPWFNSLYGKEEFYKRIKELYEAVFLPELNNLLEVEIEEYSNLITVASVMNSYRWNSVEEVTLEIQKISHYMKERKDFLYNIWINGDEYSTVKFDTGKGLYYAYYCCYNGKKLSQLPKLPQYLENKFLGWYYADTDEPFDASKPIYEDTEVYAKWQEVGSSKAKDLIKLAPVGIIAVLFFVLCIIEFNKYRKNSKVGK